MKKGLNDTVLLPTKLTAENGAKALLIGEFFETIEIPNEEYCGCGKCDFCTSFPDTEPTVLTKVAVSWNTIKQIYSKIVKEYATQSQQAASVSDAPPVQNNTKDGLTEKQIQELLDVLCTISFSSHNQMKEAINGAIEMLESYRTLNSTVQTEKAVSDENIIAELEAFLHKWANEENPYTKTIKSTVLNIRKLFQSVVVCNNNTPTEQSEAVELPNGIDLKKLSKLLKFSDKYEISIQFWPDQIAVFIEKDGIDLTDFGGDFGFAIGASTEYLNRITKSSKSNP